MTTATSWNITRCERHRDWNRYLGAVCPDPCDDCTSRPVFELDVPMVVQLKTGLRPLSHNDRFHWRAKAKKIRTIRQQVALHARNARIPAAQHITVTLHYQPSGRSVTDAPNLTATSKPAIDGLVDAGIVPDDTDPHVTERMPVIHPGKGDRRLWIEVEIQP
ncbi:hypothetical protein ABZ863_01755 [Saccharomonospora sp. NPDC046836]|uniref:hypothetical protein n=1 Tax=Saccharomonospora sp. NPDC046836 TaxID=3156921 RepID=UPI003410FF17